MCVSRSPPRPSPGGLHYSDDDICNNYNGAVLTETTTLTEKQTEVSESEVPFSPSVTASPRHASHLRDHPPHFPLNLHLHPAQSTNTIFCYFQWCVILDSLIRGTQRVPAQTLRALLFFLSVPSGVKTKLATIFDTTVKADQTPLSGCRGCETEGAWKKSLCSAAVCLSARCHWRDRGEWR